VTLSAESGVYCPPDLAASAYRNPGEKPLATGPKSLPGFAEQNIVLPERLWTRVEQFASDSAREPSEVVAEALRLLVTGAAATAAIPVSGGTSTTPASTHAPEDEAEPINVPVAPAGSGSVELLLADVHDEAADSAKLMERLVQVMETVDQRDGFADSHSRAVADLALQLGDSAGISGAARVDLEIAAFVHDLGKMRVPEEILNKQGRLTADEWALVTKYPEFGVAMLGPFANLQGVRDIVGAHQERWDGSGYPDGLKGDAVPLPSQIIGLCDVYAVLTAERSYRPALDADTARETIEAGSDRLWNPELVGQLLEQKR